MYDLVYDYAQERPWTLTDEGQRALLRVRDRAADLFAKAGAATLAALTAAETGDSFHILALIDRLEEIGDIRRAYTPALTAHRVYVPSGTLASRGVAHA